VQSALRKYLDFILLTAGFAGSLSAQNVSLSVDASINGGSPTPDPTTPNTASASGTTPLPPGSIPAMSHIALLALGLLLAALALRR
jgi:hypothetical protein